MVRRAVSRKSTSSTLSSSTKTNKSPVGLAYAAQASRSETQSFLSYHAGARMPREIHAIRERFVASIVHHNQFPLVVGQSLLSECADAPLEVIAARVVGADDDGNHYSQRTDPLEHFASSCVLLGDNLMRKSDWIRFKHEDMSFAK